MDIVSLLEEVAKEFEEISADFYEHPDCFSGTEIRTYEICMKLGTKFQTMLLENLDQIVRENAIRKGRFVAQRSCSRTLITTMGDVTFSRTKYRDKETGSYRLLVDELLKP